MGDWAQVLTKSYAVYLPEDYDGLVFAAEAQPDNYKDSAKRMQMDSISPEAALMDFDTGSLPQPVFRPLLLRRDGYGKETQRL